MKKSVLFLLLILCLSCKNHEKEYIDVIKNDNKILYGDIQDQTYKLMIMCREDNRHDSIFCKKLSKIGEEINKIEKYSDYEKIFKNLKKIETERTSFFKLKSIKSENTEVLKNHLLHKLHELNNRAIGHWCK